MKMTALVFLAIAASTLFNMPQASAAATIDLSPSRFPMTEACSSAASCPESSMTATFKRLLFTRVTSVTLGDTENFSIRSNGCSGVVPLSGCDIQLRFHPRRPGHLQTTLTVKFIDELWRKRSATAVLKGRGYVPALHVAPLRINFGGKALNSDKEWMYVDIANPALIDIAVESTDIIEGSDAAFGVDGECLKTLAPGESCTMGVSFEPTDPAKVNTPVEGWVDVRARYEEDQEVDLEGFVLPEDVRDLNYSRSALAFAARQIGTESDPQTFAITNVGTLAVTIASIESNSADFPSLHDCPVGPETLAVRESCTVSVKFAPQAAGAREGAVIITSDAPEVGTTFEVALSGSGIHPDEPSVVLSSKALDFGSQTVGTSSETLFVVLTNAGGAPLAVSDVTTGAPFTLETDCTDNVVSPNGGRCAIAVTFAPTEIGAAEGEVTIVDDAPDSPQTIALEGFGTARADPQAQLSSVSIDFGDQFVETGSVQTLTVKNTGNSDLEIALTSLDGEGIDAYSMADGCRYTSVEPGTICKVDFIFLPTTAGTTYTVTYTMDDNTADSPHSVPLTGRGILPPADGGCSLAATGVASAAPPGAALASALILLAALRPGKRRRR